MSRIEPGHPASSGMRSVAVLGARASTSFDLRTFGRLMLRDPSDREIPSLSTRPRKLALLAWLALRPQRSATRDSIIGVFWGERDETRARNSLSDAVSHLRRVLGRETIRAIGNEVLIADGAPLRIDALELCVAAAQGDHERVVALHAGPFLDGFYVADAPDFDDWRDRERHRLGRVFAQSARIRCEALFEAGAWAESRTLAERWLAVEPASTEAALAMLRAIRAPASRAAHADVLAAYDSLTRRLDRDIGIAPDPAVTAFANECASLLAVVPTADRNAVAEWAPIDAENGQTLRPVRNTVGRARERSALRESFESAARGQGILVSVSGEPGIGKTTLVEDVLGELVLDDRRPLVARGRCSERLAGSDAYLPILDALDGLLRGGSADAVGRLMKRFAPTWFLHVVGATTELTAEERALLNVQANSQGRMKRELSAFIEELCRNQTLVLFFDDLHWSDPSTIDVLAYLSARLAALRIAIIVAVRPAELLMTRHPFAQLKRDLQARGICRELELDFLSAGEIAEFVDREFSGHDFPAEFSTLIHGRTEGSPLFMTDLLRYLRVEGTVSNLDGGWRLTAPLAGIAGSLPESIRGMIQRKIEQLSEPERKLLAAASVQGYQFDTAILARLTGLEPASLEEQLEPLDQVHAFIRRVREHELPTGGINVRYRFVHVLYQNALYASLPPSRRASLSALAADGLVALHGADSREIAVELAQLYDAARDPARAVEQLIIAAEASIRLFANQEAIGLARRGLELIALQPEAPKRFEGEARLLTSMGVALGALHGMAAPEAGTALGRAYQLWQRLGARPDLFSVAGALWTFHIVAGQLEIALAIGNELFQLSEQTKNPAMQVTANNCLGITLHHLGEHRRAAEHFARGRQAYSPDLRTSFFGLPVDPGVGFIAESSRVLWVLGYPEQGLRHALEAIHLAEEIKHPESIGFANLFGAFLYQLLDDPDKTLDYAAAVLAVAKERDVATTLAWGMCAHGWALGKTGRLADGIAELRDSLAIQRQAGAEVARPQFDWMLGDLLFQAQRFDEAGAAAEDGLHTAARTGDHYWDSELRRLQAAIVLRTGGLVAEAEHHLSAALADAAAREAKSLELRAATALARLHASRGQLDESKRILRPVYEWFTEGLGTPDLRAARYLLDK